MGLGNFNVGGKVGIIELSELFDFLKIGDIGVVVVLDSLIDCLYEGGWEKSGLW